MDEHKRIVYSFPAGRWIRIPAVAVMSSLPRRVILAAESLVTLDASDKLIPAPFYMALQSSLQSESNDVTVASGTAARQSESHDGTFRTGIRSYPIAKDTTFDLGYVLLRHDFLGAF